MDSTQVEKFRVWSLKCRVSSRVPHTFAIRWTLSRKSYVLNPLLPESFRIDLEAIRATIIANRRP